MNKLKLLMAACALLLGTTATWARTDVTNTYLTNAGLTSLQGWTILDGTMAQGGYQDWKADGDVPVIEFYHTWNSDPNKGAIGTTKTFNFSQKANLPAGYYRLAVNAFYREGGNGNGTNTKAYIYAGEKTQYVVGLNVGGLNGYTGDNDLYKAANAFSQGAYSNEFDFTVTEAGEIEIGFHGYIDTYCSWCILGPVTLWEYTAEDYMADYDAKVVEAEALYDKKMNAAVLAALKEAAGKKATLVTVDDVTNAVSALTTAINNANNSIVSYSSLKSAVDAYNAKTELLDEYGINAANEAGASSAIAAYNNGTATDGATEKAALDAAFRAGVLATKQPGNGLDMTPYIENPGIDGNVVGWTTEMRGEGYMGGPLKPSNDAMEFWGASTLDTNANTKYFDYYQTITNLPTGAYTISADLLNSTNGEEGAIWNDGGNAGVYGKTTSDEVQKLVYIDGETFTTYTTDIILVRDGELRIGVKNINPLTGRWFACDNFKLTYARQLTAEEIAANKVPESISLDQNSVNMTIYETATLTATVLPEDATDKTVVWTTSDAAVATVDDGVVTAVGVGTATITASAHGADIEPATATITVTDVTPVAAPAFYSEIAEGDFYIVNAATGKFLGGANSWGTQASLIEHGIPFTVATLGDGKYTLDSHTYESDAKHFFTGTYVDGVSTEIFIVSKGNGKYSLSTADGSQFVSAKTGTTVVDNTVANANSVLAQWYFISKSDRDKMLAATPSDATYYIKEANFSRNWGTTGKNVSAWTGAHTKGGDNSNMNSMVQNAAADVYQIIENIPNGTYTAKVQAVTSGAAKFYANEVEVDIESKDDVTSQAIASNAFGGGYFTTTLNVTVTDRTLRIGVKSDDTDKVLYFDNFQLLMTQYNAVTAVDAEIDNDEVEVGKTARITAATNPADASFNKLTFASDNEEVATVDQDGLVTAVAVGTANITITADEMENKSTTIEVTVVEPAIIPTDIDLNETEIALNPETTTFQLTATVNPDGANQDVTFASNNEAVATVSEDGVITAVSSGTATITVTSVAKTEIIAEATVTVTFPESEYALSSYTNDGATRTIVTLGENLIKNGTFGYPDALYGWKTVGYTTDAVASNFTITATGGVNDGAYITTNGGGTSSEKTLRRSFAVEAGETYYFSVYTSGKAPASNNFQYNALFAMSDATTESAKLKEFEWPQGADNTTTEWNKTEFTFTATTDFVGVRMGWNEASKFDNFVLAKVKSSTTEGNVDYATAAIPTANIGTGAFQYSQDAIDAANALVQGKATVAEVQAAYEAVTTLNVPAATQAYNIVFNCEGHSATGNALTLIPNPAQTQGLYGLKYLAEANVNLAQAFYFTHTTGNKYKIHAIDTDGNQRYITTQAEGYGTTWYEGIRTIDDATKAMEVEIRPNGEGLYLMWNVGANKPLGHNGSSNNDLFTNNTADFQFIETTKPSVAINTTAAGWGTTILPFAVALPEGVKAYSCAEIGSANKSGEKTLTLVEVDALEANKPYIIQGKWNETVTGDALGTALNYTDGLLTGVYAQGEVPAGSYVLQKNNDIVGFYRVADGEDMKPDIKANRAYLTVSGDNARAVYFLGDNETTGISAINALVNGEAQIFDANGRTQQRLVKGMNIIRTKDGKVQKVMVK